MQEIKAEDIVLIDLRNIPNSVTDYFVICTGNSDSQVNAICSSIDKVVYEEAGEDPIHVEGRTFGEWVLLDYGNVVAHVFKRERRDYYRLEDLWGDAKITEIPNIG